MTFNSKSILTKLGLLAVSLACVFSANAQTTLAQSPMLTLKTAPGLVMLTMGRDLPLFKAAYNDVNDLDGDGIPDIYFKPGFKYDGYFAYDRCYNYDTGNSRFNPSVVGNVVTPDANDTSKNYYKCPGSWSGNFLNWVSMARIDVLRKVLYGGNRSTDTTTSTILERAYVPQDSTLWGKEYLSVANDGYSITDYTPLALPTGTTRHMFANATLTKDTKPGAPKLFVYQNRPGRVWDLVATENLILGNNPGTNPAASSSNGSVITPYVVRVSTCIAISGKREDWCTSYTNASGTIRYKPTGLLHKYGEAKTLAFGLISGTYDNNYAGGVLRQNIDNFAQEVDATNGNFTSYKGIVHHLSSFKPIDFKTNGSWGCGNFAKLPNNGDCPAWGNPLGEMMFEGLNYFSGGTPSAAYTVTETKANAAGLSMQQPTWQNPYATSTTRLNKAAYPSCARPIQMTIGDPKTSFDSDQLPGGVSIASNGVNMGLNSQPTLGTLSVADEAKAIWTSEFGFEAPKTFFIGEVLGNADGNPSAKNATSFAGMRGHGPDATTNEGSFYGASVARYGKFTGLTNTGINLRTDQISIALDSHVPQIKIPVNGKTVSIVLISKSIFGNNANVISRAKGDYQQTGAITAFFIDQMANTPGQVIDSSINGGLPYYKFRISFSDTDQGNDNESDAKVTYVIRVTSANTLSIGVEYFECTTFVEMHMGYVISGTTQDGVYLDVGAKGVFQSGGVYTTPIALPTVGYYLDTMPNRPPGSAMTDPVNVSGVPVTPTGPGYTNILSRLPTSTLAAPRTFTVGTGTGGEFVPHDMLWYAAKYGGATIDKTGAFTGFKLKPNGDPENYYFANNPSALAAQIGQAFQKAASLSIATASAAASSGVKVSGGNLVYQASFDSNNWGGEIRAYAVKADGNIENNASWVASVQQPAPTSRNVVLGLATSASPTLKSSPLNAGSFTSVTGGATLFKDDATFRYLLGDRTNEQGATGGTNKFRKRTSAIGDIVNSDPLYVGKSDFGYTDTGYDTFKAASDPKLIGVGSNDGFYRLLSATTGAELLAFIPKTTSFEMVKLADPAYTHQYFVDGPSAWGHVNFGTATTPDWNAIVAGSLGAGGKAVFALNASAANLGTTNNGVLWEFIGTNDGSAGDYLGNVLNKPIVAQLSGASGKPAVLVGNGINSTNNKASLLVLNAETGVQIANCTPLDAANALGNGMTTIAPVSVAKNGKVDFVYAGDYKGNIWRIDPNLGSGNCDSVKVFTAKDSNGKLQPITGDLTITAAPGTKSGYMIIFGTGKFSSSEDASNTDPQTMYGVWDENTTTATKNALRGDLISYPFGTYSTTNQTRKLETQANVNGGKAWYDTTGKKGWLVDLACSGCPAGERFLDKPLIAGSATNPVVYFLTYVPGADVCNVGGDGWVTGISPLTGAHAKAYTSIDDNSVFVKGAAPRGLFIVTTEKTATKDAAEYIYVSRNGEDTSDDPPPPGSTTKPGLNDVGGEEQCVGADCISAGGKEITQPIPPSPTLGRRLIWRQIQ